MFWQRQSSLPNKNNNHQSCIVGVLDEFRNITESQNSRTLGVERDLCGSLSPTPLPKQGHLEQAAQDRVQVGLEYLQRRRLHNLPGQPVPEYEWVVGASANKVNNWIK